MSPSLGPTLCSHTAIAVCRFQIVMDEVWMNDADSDGGVGRWMMFWFLG
jgi:hypothetical protein